MFQKKSIFSMPKNLTWTQQQEDSVTITMQVVVYPLQLRGQINSF